MTTKRTAMPAELLDRTGQEWILAVYYITEAGSGSSSSYTEEKQHERTARARAHARAPAEQAVGRALHFFYA